MGAKDYALNAQNAELKTKIAKQPKTVPVGKGTLRGIVCILMVATM